MFKKYQSGLATQQVREEMDKMNVNHEFFLLVRQKKYEEAYKIGMMYLQYHPQNNPIRQFCQFIEGNRLQLLQMVEDEEYESDDGSDQDQEDEQDSDQDDKSVLSDVSIASSTKSMKTVKSAASSLTGVNKTGSKVGSNKQNSKINPSYKWQHQCKNDKCPNKNKK